METAFRPAMEPTEPVLQVIRVEGESRQGRPDLIHHAPIPGVILSNPLDEQHPIFRQEVPDPGAELLQLPLNPEPLAPRLEPVAEASSVVPEVEANDEAPITWRSRPIPPEFEE